jgi:cytochrome b pre-mRNA-processing protein 3
MRANEAARKAAQDVFDLFFQDMDESMRELGIGDLAVPRKIRAIGEAFYGRARAYDEALRTQESAKLSQALHRNVFAGSKGTALSAEKLAEYTRSVESFLAVQEADFIVRGEPMFPAPMGFFK